MAVLFAIYNGPEHIVPGGNAALHRILAGQHVCAVSIALPLELFLHGQGHYAHQSRQQNPHHFHTLLTVLVIIMQETLQRSSCIIHYMHLQWKIKMTMQDFMKK